MDEPEVPASAGDGPEVDLAAARQLFDGDETTLRLVSLVFLDEIGDQLGAVRTAVAARDAAKLAESAHRLKGSISLFAARRATELAELLQRVGVAGALDEAPRLLAELEGRVSGMRTEIRTLLRVPPEAAADRAGGRAAGGGRG